MNPVVHVDLHLPHVDHSMTPCCCHQGAVGRRLLQDPSSVGLLAQVTAPADQLPTVTQALNTAISDGSLQQALSTAGTECLTRRFGCTSPLYSVWYLTVMSPYTLLSCHLTVMSPCTLLSRHPTPYCHVTLHLPSIYLQSALFS